MNFYKIFLIAFIFTFQFLISPHSFSNWRMNVEEFKIGLSGGENEADRLKNYECWRVYLENKLNIPVKFYPASDVAGIIHGLLGKTIDYASVGPSAYAAMFIDDSNAVEPVITVKESDGSNGYKSAIYVRADSDIYSIEDLKGKAMAGQIQTQLQDTLFQLSSFIKWGLIHLNFLVGQVLQADMSKL